MQIDFQNQANLKSKLLSNCNDASNDWSKPNFKKSL